MKPILFLALLLLGLLAAGSSARPVASLTGKELPGDVLYEEIISAPEGAPWLRVFFSELVLPPGVLLVVTSLHDGATQHLDRHVASLTGKELPGDVLYEEIISAPEGAPWLRVFFSELVLPPGVLLVVTSLHDGATQHLDRHVASQWQASTAYFNGDSVQLQFVFRPHPLLERDPGLYAKAFLKRAVGHVDGWEVGMEVEEVQHGGQRVREAKEEADGGQKSICFNPDTRVFSNDTRQGRYIYGDPNGCCTAWIINDANHCFLSAGHCSEAGKGLVEFNVPMSEDDGTLVHPPPIHQYIVDQSSMQTEYAGTRDWRYFGVFLNSESGLHPIQAYSGEFYKLKTSGSTSPGALLRITGYGENEGFPDSHRRVLKTAVGYYSSGTTGTVSYRVDTSNGNSGSAVFDEDAGVAIGIHTLGGCNVGSSSSTNSGVNILLSSLQQALASPKGVCAGL